MKKLKIAVVGVIGVALLAIVAGVGQVTGPVITTQGLVTINGGVHPTNTVDRPLNVVTVPLSDAAITGNASSWATMSVHIVQTLSVDTPIVLGLSTTYFKTVTFIGNKLSRTQNTSTVYIQSSSLNDFIGISLEPGETVSWTAPEGKYLNASQFWIDSDVVGDGVVAVYMR